MFGISSLLLDPAVTVNKKNVFKFITFISFYLNYKDILKVENDEFE